MIQFAVIILPTAAVYTALVGLVAGAGFGRSLLAGVVAGIFATAAFELTVLLVDQAIGYHIVGTEGQKVMPRIATLGLALTGFLGAAIGLWLFRPGSRGGALRSPIPGRRQATQRPSAESRRGFQTRHTGRGELRWQVRDDELQDLVAAWDPTQLEFPKDT